MAATREWIEARVLDLLRRDRLPHPAFPLDGEPIVGTLRVREFAAVVFGLWTCKPRSCWWTEGEERCRVGAYRPNADAVTEAQEASIERALSSVRERETVQSSTRVGPPGCSSVSSGPPGRPAWAQDATRTRSLSTDAGYCPHCHALVVRLDWNADHEAPCHQCGRRIVAYSGFWYRSYAEAAEGCERRYRDWLVCKAAERDRCAKAIEGGIAARIARAMHLCGSRDAADSSPHEVALHLVGDGEGPALPLSQPGGRTALDGE